MKKEPPFKEYADQLVKEGALSSDDRDKLFANWKFFESQREKIKQEFRLQWVAALDNQLFSAPTLRDLTSKLDPKNGAHVYIEKVPSF